VAHDRANLLPPNKQAQEKGWTNGFIHFDIDVSQRPLPIAVQGVLSLTRQGGELGGFQAVPGIFHEIEPPGSSPFKPDTTGREIVNVPLNPGDLLIFNSQLAHGVRPNVSLGHVLWLSTSRCFLPTSTTRRSARNAFEFGPNRRTRSAILSLVIRVSSSEKIIRWPS
jgi:ectoine hydroxylase-related dioxygenase (phytanoyl-CoA dioxygenase family)